MSWTPNPNFGAGAVSGAGNRSFATLNPLYLSVMALPPTVSSSTTNPQAAGRFYSATSQDGTKGGIGNSAFALFRGRYWKMQGSSYPGYLWIAANTFFQGQPATYSDNHWRLSFIHTGAKFTIFLSGSGAVLNIKADGQMVSYTPTTVVADGGLWYITVDFGATARRRIDIDGSSFRLGGVYTEPGDNLRPAPKRGPSVVVPADSFGEGTGNEVAGLYSWIWHLAEALGWDDVIPSAVGGTGLTAGGAPRVNFAGRAVRDIAGINPDVLLIPPSVNDSFQTPVQIVAAIQNLIDTCAAAGWAKEIVIAAPATNCGIGWLRLVSDQAAAIKSYCAGKGYKYLDTLHQANDSTAPQHIITLTANASANATSLTTSEAMIPGASYQFPDGSTVFSTGLTTVDSCSGAQVSGAQMKQVGEAWITGIGVRAIFTTALAAATSATLNQIWGRGTGSWRMRFSDGTEQTGTFANNSTAVTWGAPVTGSAWAAVYQVGGMLGSSSYSISSDGTHPSDFGHRELGYSTALQWAISSRG